MTRPWIIAVSSFVICAALFSAALYFGWIGHRSIDWVEFRNQVARGEHKELHVSGQTIRVGTGPSELIVHAPSDAELKALIYNARQVSVQLVFDK